MQHLNPSGADSKNTDHRQPSISVLAIDDDDAVRESIVACLEDNGYRVFEARNGKEGIDAFRLHKPDVILCDLRMPDIDGLEVLEIVTRESPRTPIIVISGAGLIQDVVEALRLGAWDYLVKPIPDLTMLEHAVKSVLRRSHLEQENNQYREELDTINRELESNLLRLQEDTELGKQAQLQLLPEPSGRYGEYQFSHTVIPSLYLSGDFLDYFAIDDRYLGFYIADVSGHGSSSAFVTMMLKSFINQPLRQYRIYKQQTILDPATVLQNLNTEVLQANLGKYLTMFYAVVDREREVLRYSIGGHYPRPILLGDRGKPKIIEGNGFPIGLFDWAKYESQEINLPKRFTLSMFSDGLLEVLANPNDEDKEKWLLNMCRSHKVTIANIVEQLRSTCKKAPPDDITLFMLQRKTR